MRPGGVQAEVGSQSPSVGRPEFGSILSGVATARHGRDGGGGGRGRSVGGRIASLYVSGYNAIARAAYSRVGLPRSGRSPLCCWTDRAGVAVSLPTLRDVTVHTFYLNGITSNNLDFWAHRLGDGCGVVGVHPRPDGPAAGQFFADLAKGIRSGASELSDRPADARAALSKRAGLQATHLDGQILARVTGTPAA